VALGVDSHSTWLFTAQLVVVMQAPSAFTVLKEKNKNVKNAKKTKNILSAVLFLPFKVCIFIEHTRHY